MPKGIDNLQLITWGLMAALFIWLLLLSVRVWRMARSRRYLDQALRQDGDLPKVISRILGNIDALESEQEVINKTLKKHRSMLSETTSRVAMVRYDAFRDVGGCLSFSVAILNEKGDGLVITAINGRSETRVYAKPIENRESGYPLSEEEQEVINQALDKSKPKKIAQLENSR